MYMGNRPCHYPTGRESLSMVLISRWRLQTSRDRLWNLLTDPIGWPRWWPHLAAVDRLASGDAAGVGSSHAFCWRSGLGYRIRVVMTTTRTAPQRELEGSASGDLYGVGLWIIEDDAPGAVRLTYRWDVELGKPWMRRFAPLLRPVFARRHFAVMTSGAYGMARELRCRVSEMEEWSTAGPILASEAGRRS